MSTFYPINFCNRNGIPMMETSSVTVNDTNVTFTLTNRSFRFLNDKGILLFRLNQVVPSGTDESLPIIFSTNDFDVPLVNIGGTPITVELMSLPGVYLIYYDKYANLLQLMTGLVCCETTSAEETKTSDNQD
ncbi:MAG: hypothetical protein J6N78_04530 [Clostridia bacterium]|nr:hypothetical protein [Clostridia bacterium]